MSFIKYFESTDAGAPTLNNAVGSLIAVLDACLVTGYNTKSVASITVASGVATVVCTAHGFSNGYAKILRIEGATGSYTGLNKDTDISGVTTNGFTFLCPGVPDGVATGTISAKYAPLDFVKQFSGTNLAMYKSGDVTATGCLLRVDDTAVGQMARVIMVHTATDINTYTNPSPTPGQISGGQYWSKGYNNATAASWTVIGDGKLFYLMVSAAVAATLYIPHGFGDIVDFKPGSVLGCVIFGNSSTSYSGFSTLNTSIVSGGAHFLIAGAKSGLASSAIVMIDTALPSYGASNPVYPSDVDGGLIIQYPVLIREGANDGHRRGLFPGFAVPLANITVAIPSKSVITNDASNKKFLATQSPNGGPGNATAINVNLIDLTGPWR